MYVFRVSAKTEVSFPWHEARKVCKFSLKIQSRSGLLELNSSDLGSATETTLGDTASSPPNLTTLDSRKTIQYKQKLCNCQE